jgi:competence protein ComGC
MSRYTGNRPYSRLNIRPTISLVEILTVLVIVGILSALFIRTLQAAHHASPADRTLSGPGNF